MLLICYDKYTCNISYLRSQSRRKGRISYDTGRRQRKLKHQRSVFPSNTTPLKALYPATFEALKK